MRTTTRMAALVAALLLGTALSAAAQQQQDHQTHHPQGAQAQTQPAQPPAPTQALPRQPAGPGTGMGMMGQGGMGGMGGMGMGGGPMMGGGMMGPGMMGGGMMGGMALMTGPQHIDGRLAFLRTELKITDPQQRAWDDFAAAMRSAAKSLQTAHASMRSGAADGGAQAGQTARPGPMGQGGMGMMGPGGMGMGGGTMGMMGAGENPVTHLEHHEQVYTARLEALRAVKGPLTALYNALDDTQKRTLAQLRPLYMAMM
jgi:hypothetical protein